MSISETETQLETIIKHIVISGGGVNGFSFYGVLRETASQKLWKMENIETIYGTSIGSMLAVMISLKYDWETLDDFLIKRPWNQVYKFDMYSILDSFQKRGIFNIKVIEDTFLPLFKGKDIPIDITLSDFHDLTGVDIHFFTTEIVEFTLTDISYKTHPDWRVTEAVFCSCALPVVLAPLIKNDKCYVDGGLLCNYPIQQCIQNGAKPNEILGVTRVSDTHSYKKISEDSTLLDCIMAIIAKTVEKIFATVKLSMIEHEYCVPAQAMSIYDIHNVTSNIEMRNQFIQKGVDIAKKYFDVGVEMDVDTPDDTAMLDNSAKDYQ